MNKMNCLLLVLISAFLFADGIPVSNGKITVPHELITLDSNQVEELTLMGTITLTPDQYTHCRKISRFCPKRITYIFQIGKINDCTCGILFYVIQVSGNQIAVLLESESPESDISFSFENLYEGAIGFRFNCDLRGQFYYAGVLIPFQELKKIIENAPTGFQEEKVSNLIIQLPFGLNRKSKVIVSRLDEIEKITKKLKIELTVY